ncbi:helix-turn-helix domain-containing protein, partial [Pusillimonas sp.]|uniref:helix-turn-helix domain-containing protein n=1 Tax=Pusillimonas sp. TaxID=3040095 RepID=UPI0037C62C24
HDYWSDGVSRVFARLVVTPADHQEIDCRLVWRDIGRARLTSAAGSPQSVCRTSETIASDAAASIIIMFQNKGVATLLHRGRSVDLSPGTMVAMDTRSPYRLSFLSNFEQHVLRVPANVLGDHSDDTNPLTATALNTSFASRLLLASFSAAGQVCPHQSDDLEPTLFDLTRLALYAGAPALKPGSTADRFQQACSYIRAHTAVADLTPQLVADKLGISLRTLQKVFAIRGMQPSSYILQQRLSRVGELLARPDHAHRSVADIAGAYGFLEPSHFSRIFRIHFGMSPREWRKRSADTQMAEPFPAARSVVRYKSLL